MGKNGGEKWHHDATQLKINVGTFVCISSVLVNILHCHPYRLCLGRWPVTKRLGSPSVLRIPVYCQHSCHHNYLVQIFVKTHHWLCKKWRALFTTQHWKKLMHATIKKRWRNLSLSPRAAVSLTLWTPRIDVKRTDCVRVGHLSSSVRPRTNYFSLWGSTLLVDKRGSKILTTPISRAAIKTKWENVWENIETMPATWAHSLDSPGPCERNSGKRKGVRIGKRCFLTHCLAGQLWPFPVTACGLNFSIHQRSWW